MPKLTRVRRTSPQWSHAIRRSGHRGLVSTIFSVAWSFTNKRKAASTTANSLTFLSFYSFDRLLTELIEAPPLQSKSKALSGYLALKQSDEPGEEFHTNLTLTLYKLAKYGEQI